MSQYQVGTIEVTKGSATVTSVDPDAGNGILSAALWSTEVTPGDLFYVKDDPVAYTVQSVVSDTELTLSAAYSGTTVTASGSPLAGAFYAVHRKFSTHYNMPLVSQGDIGLPVFIEYATVMIDTEMAALDARVTALGG